ncbi:putative Glycosyl transferase, group 1 [Nitrospira sp. KM1]|uniref:glycosyltransferase n=1 Tax=Nitrospira sp. KM1 TaxID=1936990 RepID=UPI0013A72401|nr:glycosyltransferase [Nitrospira sp. KM1]BCA54456.1 putative Glycosyl transferase, group 1 [Nitrospira sp. KM1]
MDTVCHVITQLELGGAQEVALHTVSHLDPTWFTPILVTGPGGLLTEEARQISRVQVAMIPALARAINPVRDAAALIALVRFFRHCRPTIVHTHSSKAGILGRWAAWIAGVPVIVHTVHGYGVTPAQSRWLQWALVRLERFTGWITTHWIAVSESDVRKGREWKLFGENISLIRPGIDPQPFRQDVGRGARERIRREWGMQPNEWLVGSVACLKPQKAPEDFVTVARAVCAAMPTTRFVLIGDGELRSAVESRIREAGLENRIHLAGWRRDIPDVMRAMDVFLLTSHWEGLPRVILEARASGLPIVASDVGGTVDALKGYQQARVARVGDVDGLSKELINTVDQLISSLPDRPQPGEFPREFHIDEMVRSCEMLYGELIQKWQIHAHRRPDKTLRSELNSRH